MLEVDLEVGDATTVVVELQLSVGTVRPGTGLVRVWGGHVCKGVILLKRPEYRGRSQSRGER
jgi:hypothetical protein